MRELYLDNIETIDFKVWLNNQPVESETVVTVSITSGGEEIDYGFATFNPATSSHEYTPSPIVFSEPRTIVVEWDYTIDGVNLSKKESISIVTPYVQLQEFEETFPGFSGLTPESFRSIERSVRYVINTFCGQTFEKKKNVNISVNIGTSNKIYSPVRILKINHAYIGYGSVINYLAVDPSGYVIGYPNVNGFVDVKADIGLPGSPTLFRRGDTININADIGWESVPDEVAHAAKLLVARYLEPESEWHRNRVESINMSDHRVLFTGNPYASTGDNQVDQILEGFKLFQPGVI